MCKALLSCEEEYDPSRPFTTRYGTGYGKPQFPNINSIKVIGEPAELIGRDSWGFFTTLKMKTDFLRQPVSDWATSDSYKDAESKVKSLRVVNDPAERGCKMAVEFQDSAQSEERYQCILQIAEFDRNENPNQRKKLKR